VGTASAGSGAVCHPTTIVSTELNRSLAAQHRSDVGTCRSIDRRLRQVAGTGAPDPRVVMSKDELQKIQEFYRQRYGAENEPR
jgi:hypothetical protein